MKNNALVIENLSHSYSRNNQSNMVLNSINLEIKEGELLGLLGPSGCGKTTLLRLIAGFDKPLNGRISLHENEISNKKKVIAPEKRNIGMVFQDYALFPHLNVFENAVFGLKSKNDWHRVDYLLDVLGIENLRTRFPHELSGGQKQRLAIARALAPGTSFLLLDEPFCSLDLKVKLRLRSELPNILKNFKTSGMLVTHDPEEAMAICDRVAVMNDGFIHQHDKPAQLMRHPKTLFVSSFIMDNNIFNVKFENGYFKSIIGEFKVPILSDYREVKFLSISPKSLSIERCQNGSGRVVSKEFLGEYFVYKIAIGDDYFRVRTDISNEIDLNERCNIKPLKNEEFFLFPGAYKNTFQ